MPPDARQDLPTPGALADALPERPAGSYFHQPQQHPQPVAVMALAKADPGTAEGETLAEEELVQAPVAVMAGTEGVAPDASAPAPRSRRTASPPRKSSGRKAAAAGSSAQVDAGAPAAPSPKAVAPAAAPAKAAATSARKPRGPGKSPRSAGE
jgi:hypothetical protein